MTRMQGFKLFFAGFLGIMVFLPTWADDGLDVARAATRRGTVQNSTVTNTQTVRQKTTGTGAAAASNRITNAAGHANVQKTTKGAATTSVSTRNVVGTRGVVSTRGTETTASRNAVGRSVVGTRTTGRTGNQINSNTHSTSVSRTAVIPISTTKTTGVVRTSNNTINMSRNAANLGAITSAASKRGEKNGTSRVGRSATTALQALSADDIKNRKYSKCQTVYNECMDEFCANKDTQLKRCACSARKDEFNSVKRRLGVVEDKLLSFNQRLLTVNMSPEDVQAMTQATEGEDGFYGTKDTSESQSILNQISKKLNKNFKKNDFDTNLNSISLTLDTDAAFDSVDSLQGAATTSKTGVELYRAALPVCREMAAEVCSDMDLSLAESGYQMLIEQDCNIVSKGYQSQADQAREQVFDSSALLDMARLDVRQTQNSDDKLTCKKKMLDMLTDSTVCGANLGQCLDVTGQYINPTTGQAVLSVNLKNLVTLIESPKSVDEKWRDVTKNKAFVDFLNDKKKYLSVAMENCQDVADDVWYDFMEDALAQIKLAQRQKLDVMQQGCTALTTQCLSDADQSIENFDTRALSVFGVVADKTSREFCNEITASCAALIEAMNKEQENNTLIWKKENSDTVDLENALDDDSWIGGMTQIAVDKTFDRIIDACTEVGKNCIIDTCRSINGNFGLCENIQESINRKSIINRTACWNEVMDCVANAGDEAVSAIIKRLLNTQYTETKCPLENKDGEKINKCTYSNSTNSTNSTQITNPLFKNMLGYSGFLGTCNDTNATEDGVEKPNGPCIYNKCDDLCKTGETDADCIKCRLTEYIWGNCNFDEKTVVEYGTNDDNKKGYNQILIPSGGKETLLSWFAKNTGTTDSIDSCRDTTCPAGMEEGWMCSDQAQFCDDDKKIWECTRKIRLSTNKKICEYGDQNNMSTYVTSYSGSTPIISCCYGEYDYWHNCWGKKEQYWGDVKDIDSLTGVFADTNSAKKIAGLVDGCNNIDSCTVRIMIPDNAKKVEQIAGWKGNLNDSAGVQGGAMSLNTGGGSNNTFPNYTLDVEGENFALFCVGKTTETNVSGTGPTEDYPSGQEIKCNGRFVIINLKTGYYFTPTEDSDYNGLIEEYGDGKNGNSTVAIPLKHTVGGTWGQVYKITENGITLEESATDIGQENTVVSWGVHYTVP